MSEPQDTSTITGHHTTPATPPAAPDYSTAYKTGATGAVLFTGLLVAHIPHWVDPRNWAPPFALTIFGLTIVAILIVVARQEAITANDRHQTAQFRAEMTQRIDALQNQVIEALNQMWFHGWGTGVKDSTDGEITTPDNVLAFPPRGALDRHA